MQSLSSTLLCADIGGTNMRLARIDSRTTVTHKQSIPTPVASAEQFVSSLTDLVLSMDEAIPALHISLAGLQDPETGRCHAANIPCLDGLPLASILAERLGKQVRIANDADCFTLAESRIGAGKNSQIVFGVILGTGVGGGIVLGGRLATGPQGLIGEWGHGPFLRAGDRDYPCLPCGCGQTGCIDTIGGARGLEQLHRHVTAETATSLDIIARWTAGDRSVSETMRRYIAILSDALACIINITGASCVPVGGGMSTVTPLIEALDRNVRDKVLHHSTSPIIVKTKLGNDAGLIGASYI